MDSSDEELMLAYVAGDEAAFAEIFRRYGPLLLGLLRRKLGSQLDAQDVAQQTFLQLHRARRDFRPEKRLRPWIMTIAMNLARDLLRRRGRKPEAPIAADLLAAIAAEPPRDPLQSEDAVRVRRAVQILPAEQRHVIEQHWFAEVPFEKIAARTGATAGAVRVRAHRGYVALRKALSPS
jgi:RNA polymerase sigma-70 factor, ECF subfamily